MMLNRKIVRKSFRKSKLFGGVHIVFFSIFWILFLLGGVATFWETVILDCQPQPAQIICNIQREPFLGYRSTAAIPKSQLSGVKVIRKTGKKYIDRISLTTLNHQEIPLNSGVGGEVTIQLNEQVDRIQKFIVDPQAQTLRVETYRSLPLILLPLPLLVGFMLWQSGLRLYKLWNGW
jgi:hypothetical protein